MKTLERAFSFCYNSNMPWIILFPLSLTLLIETIIYMFLKWGDIKLFVVASVANIVLNTTMNLILLSITDATAYYIVLISYEIGTTLVEALIITLFMRFKFWKTLLFAVLANGVSYLVGLLLQPVYQTRTTIIVLTIVFLALYLAFEVVTIIFYSKKANKTIK